jgi:hypothetical protein
MWSRFLLALSFAAGLQAQQDPTDLFLRVRARIEESLDRLPNYMCTQTIDRYQYQPDVTDNSLACDESAKQPSTHLSSSDRLRFDVSVKSTGEMYGWAGENRFDDRELVEIVKDGAISTGSFTAFLASIFSNEAVRFTYNGEMTQDGRPFAEFGFYVPSEKSHYFFNFAERRAVTGYDGTFLVNPKTADIARLSIRTSQLPAETGACYSSTTLDYTRIRLQGVEFLLPRLSVMRVFSRDGRVAVNHTVYSNCHEFLGESTLTFGTPTNVPSGEQRPGSAPEIFVIPPNLRFRVALTEGIDTATAAAGDSIKAKLMTPIRDRRKVLVPIGAAITGRIVEIRQLYASSPSVLLVFKLETVDAGGVTVQLAATPDTAKNFAQSKPGTLQRRIELGALRSVEERSAELEFRNVRLPYLISRGAESTWITTTPATVDSGSTSQK